MPGIVWLDPTGVGKPYIAMKATDPNVPAGYVLQSGSDGSADRDLQNFIPGNYSGGYPAYGDKQNDGGTFGGPSGYR